MLTPFPPKDADPVLTEAINRVAEKADAMRARISASLEAQFPAKHVAEDPRIVELEAEIKRLKSERSYIVGCNDGFEEGITQAAAAIRALATTEGSTDG